MAESKEYMTLPEENGSINISEEVIAAIAVGAVREVEGVSGMMTTLGGSVSDLVTNRKNAQKSIRGVKIDMTGAGPVSDRPVRQPHPRGGGKRPEGRVLRCGGHDRLRRGGGEHPCGRRDAELSAGFEHQIKDEGLWYGTPPGRSPFISPMN